MDPSINYVNADRNGCNGTPTDLAEKGLFGRKIVVTADTGVGTKSLF